MLAKFLAPPGRLADLLSIAGDKSDGIVGADGYGPVKAAKVTAQDQERQAHVVRGPVAVKIWAQAVVNTFFTVCFGPLKAAEVITQGNTRREKDKKLMQCGARTYRC